MNAAADIRSHIEPAAAPLPRRVRWYAVRRELARVAPPEAFWLGVLLGALAVMAGGAAAAILFTR